MRVLYRNQKKLGSRAQATVEFAIVLLILLMLLLGILEVGRMIFIYAAVTNASREAARYASAVGVDQDPSTGQYYQKFSYCKGIMAMARRSAYFLDFTNGTDTITISYDHGPGLGFGSPLECDAASGEDADVKAQVTSGDRVVVEIQTEYVPLVNLIPISRRQIESFSARTILGVYDLEDQQGSIPSSGSGSGSGSGAGTYRTRTPTTTPTASHTPTITLTPTNTLTNPDPWLTLTPLDTFTPSLTPSPTDTPTDTPTPTLTFTPTSTPTIVPGCSELYVSPLGIAKGYPTMGLVIRNPHDSITVLSIEVTWNHDFGGPGGAGKGTPLALTKASLGHDFWTFNPSISGPTYTLQPSGVILPGNNRSSILSFLFDANYNNFDGTEKIVLTLTSIDCGTIQITRP